MPAPGKSPGSTFIYCTIMQGAAIVAPKRQPRPSRVRSNWILLFLVPELRSTLTGLDELGKQVTSSEEEEGGDDPCDVRTGVQEPRVRLQH